MTAGVAGQDSAASAAKTVADSVSAAWHDRYKTAGGAPVWVVFGIAALVVLVVVAYLATGRGGGLAPLPGETTRLTLPPRPLTSSDLRGISLGKAVSGYRVDHVDQLVDRMADELAARDARISELERKRRFERMAKSAAPPPSRTPEVGQPAPDEAQPRAGPTEADARRDDSRVDPSRTAIE